MALGGPTRTSAAVKSKFPEIICQLLAVVGLLFTLLFTLINFGLLPIASLPPPHRLLRSELVHIQLTSAEENRVGDRKR